MTLDEALRIAEESPDRANLRDCNAALPVMAAAIRRVEILCEAHDRQPLDTPGAAGMPFTTALRSALRS